VIKHVSAPAATASSNFLTVVRIALICDEFLALAASLVRTRFDMAESKGLIHKNKANRDKARLAKKLAK
jgi:hypothetical protein